MVLHRASASEPRVWRVSLWRRYAGQAEAAGEKAACFLLSRRISSLAYDGIGRHLSAFRPLGKENTVCMTSIASRWSSL